jgi:hypothetical protein
MNLDRFHVPQSQIQEKHRPPTLSTGFIPVGSTTGQLQKTPNQKALHRLFKTKWVESAGVCFVRRGRPCSPPYPYLY